MTLKSNQPSVPAVNALPLAGHYDLVSLFERIGARVVLDFGFSGLLERFEREFGSRVTRAMLALIGLAIVSGCLVVIGNLFFAVSGWLDLNLGNHPWWVSASKIVGMILFVNIVALIAAALSLVYDYKVRGEEPADEAIRMLEAAKLIDKEAKEEAQLTKERLDEVSRILEELRELRDRVK